MSNIYEMITTYLDLVFRARMMNIEIGKDVEYNIDLFADTAKVMDNFSYTALSTEEHIQLEDYIYNKIKDLKEVATHEHDNRISASCR